MPIEYLFEPWKAPLSVQEEAECVIGRDYPEPCIDHEEAFRENIAKLQQFFHTEKKEIFDSFLNDKFALKPANSEEYRVYTYKGFLNSQFDDFWTRSLFFILFFLYININTCVFLMWPKFFLFYSKQ